MNPISKILVALVRKGAIVPKRGSGGAAGFDLHACIDKKITVKPQAQAILIPTGISLDMSDASIHGSMMGMIFPRSGLGHKFGLVLGNGTGIIDSDYTGEIMVSVWNRNPVHGEKNVSMGLSSDIIVSPGDRIAQIVFMGCFSGDLSLVSRDEFRDTDRGSDGFGSTGVK
jgi:dUTP pyrophosphatase